MEILRAFCLIGSPIREVTPAFLDYVARYADLMVRFAEDHVQVVLGDPRELAERWQGRSYWVGLSTAYPTQLELLFALIEHHREQSLHHAYVLYPAGSSVDVWGCFVPVQYEARILRALDLHGLQQGF